MSVTCLILNYNDSETTIKLLKHIAGYDVLDYITIVDNRSTDGSYERLKKYQSSKVHIISSDKNGGYGYGNNFGIRYIKENLNTSYILIANPDVLFKETTVVALKREFMKDRECAIIAPVQLKNGKPLAWKLESNFKITITASTFITALFNNKLTTYNDDFFESKDYCYVDIVSGSLLMVDTDIMLNYGMYDEDIFLYFEEIILGHKFMKSEYKSKILLNEVYQHNHSTSVKKSIKSKVKVKKLLLDSELIFFKKYRNLKGIKLSLIKMFYGYVIFETWLLSRMSRLTIIFKNRKKRIIY